MKKIMLFLSFPFLILSCSLVTDEDVVLSLPLSIPLEEMSNESIYYTLRYFDGKRVQSLHIPSHSRRVEVSVKRGLLSFFLIYPAEMFTPLSAYKEPGKDVSTFCYRDSSLIEFLMDIAEEAPTLAGNISLSLLLERYEADEIDKMEFLSMLEKGKLTLSSRIRGEKYPVKLENLIYGRWHSDRDDIPDIIVRESAESITLSLYEGVYIFIHENMDKMLTLAVSGSGEYISKVEEFRSWY